MSVALSDDNEWKVIPTEERTGAKAGKLANPGGLVNLRVAGSGGREGFVGNRMGRENRREKSKMQRALNETLRNLNSLF